MTLTITAYNANSDSVGIDLAAYLAAWDAKTLGHGGYFSSSTINFAGNEYADTEQPSLIPDTSKQSIVFESGGGSLVYDFPIHILGGTLDAVRRGYGMTYEESTDIFPLTQLDPQISGFGLSGSGPNNPVHNCALVAI